MHAPPVGPGLRLQHSISHNNDNDDNNEDTTTTTTTTTATTTTTTTTTTTNDNNNNDIIQSSYNMLQCNAALYYVTLYCIILHICRMSRTVCNSPVRLLRVWISEGLTQADS